MPNIGRKAGGRSKGIDAIQSQNTSQRFVGKPSKSKMRRSHQQDSEDTPLDPKVGYVEENNDKSKLDEDLCPVEPFEDGIVSARLRGLTVIPRVGGEESALLHDFLYLFAKTGTFIGTISSKTSFMKKAGGKLL